MGIVFRPLPPPESAGALAYWYEQATGHTPEPGVDPRPIAMRAWYGEARGQAVATMKRQASAFPFLPLPAPPPPDHDNSRGAESSIWDAVFWIIVAMTFAAALYVALTR